MDVVGWRSGWILGCLALVAVLSSISLWARHQVEAANKATGIAVEYETAESLSLAQGISLERGFENLKAQGVTHVVLGEESVAELIAEAQLEIAQVNSAGQIERSSGMSGPGLSRWLRAVDVRFGPETKAVPVSLARGLSAGLDPRHAESVQAAGLQIVGRASNPPGISGRGVRESIAWMDELGARIFLPQGDTVLGRRDAIGDLVDAISEHGMLYASPEFTKLGGDATVLQKVPDRVVRMHSAQTLELDRLPANDAIDRYARASRERNMRLLLVRPITPAASEPLSAFADFIKKIHQEIDREGGAVGVPKPFQEPGISPFLKVGIAVASLPLLMWVAFSLLPGWGRWFAVGFLGLVAITNSMSGGFEAYALLVAIGFPVAGFLLIDRKQPFSPMVGFLVVTLVCLVGGLAVAGMLNGLAYTIKADAFVGVKVAVFAPIFVVGFWFLRSVYDLPASLRSPISWGGAVLAVAIAVVLAYMATRTGNDGPGGVSSTELAFRNLLDRALFIRPRTKEFLIGHPLLVVGLGLLQVVRQRGWEGTRWSLVAVGCLMGGAIGATSVLNNLCHLHMPLSISLLRLANGAWIGLLLGLLLWELVRRTWPELRSDHRFSKDSPGNKPLGVS